MNGPFELLGLVADDADEADVKRAYARLLRTTRPDEDPDAFQRLHTAYKLALAHVSARTTNRAVSPPAARVVAAEDSALPRKEAAAKDTHSSPPTLLDATAWPAPNLGMLADEIIRAAVDTEQHEAFSSWLTARPEFWAIQVKQQVSRIVIHRLFQQPRPMSSYHLDALLHFFDLDHVLSGINPIALQQLRRRQLTLWEMIPRNHRELARRIRMMGGSQPDVASIREDLALLQRPLSTWRVMAAALQFGRVGEMGRLIQALCHGRLEELPSSIDRDHAQFWLKAAVPRTISWPRFTLGSLRAALAALGCGLAALGLSLLSGSSRASEGSAASEWLTTAEVSTIVAGTVFALWLIYAGYAWLDWWQGLPESSPSQRPWLRRLILPVLSAWGLVLYAVGPTHSMAWTLIVPSFVIAVRRFRRRNAGFSPRLNRVLPAAIVIGMACLNPLAQVLREGSLPIVPIAACAAFCMWAVDLWRHRAHLHPSFART